MTFSGSCFDLIVMDIEGSEYRALRGMPRILSATQALMLEVLPNYIDNIARVSVREFLEVLPDSLSCACVICASKWYVRGEFRAMFEEISSSDTSRRRRGVESNLVAILSHLWTIPCLCAFISACILSLI